MKSPNKTLVGLCLTLFSLLAWIAPWMINLWVYGFLIVIPIHALVVIFSLISLCLKGGATYLLRWFALALSLSYFLLFYHYINGFKYGPGP